MILYRFYAIKPDGRIFSRVERFCGDDEEALAFALSLNEGHEIEVWEHQRRVGAVPKSTPLDAEKKPS